MTSASDAAPTVQWALPTFPHEIADEPELRTVEQAFLTRVRQGPLRTVEVPIRWLTGAVHDAEGHLLVASQKIGGLGGNQGAQADPRRVTPRADATSLPGTWLYGGHWIGHFGHFFTETLTTLWPKRDSLDVAPQGLVFHRYFGRHAGLQDWQLELLELTGYGDLPIEVVDAEPRQVERLLLPSRSVVVNGWAHPGARELWQRMADAAGVRPHGEKVFFSRRVFNEAKRAAGKPVRTSEQRDVRLDRVFSDAGFRVIAPEDLPVIEQLRLAGGASVLAGSAGTALHLSAFAPAATRVIEIGDSRSPTVQVPHQRVVDCLREHPTAYVPFAVPVPRLREVLRALDVWG
ncbi:MAG: glycosyltransferase 61 family protein [Nocardioides sp.]